MADTYSLQLWFDPIWRDDGFYVRETMSSNHDRYFIQPSAIEFGPMPALMYEEFCAERQHYWRQLVKEQTARVVKQMDEMAIEQFKIPPWKFKPDPPKCKCRGIIHDQLCNRPNSVVW